MLSAPGEKDSRSSSIDRLQRLYMRNRSSPSRSLVQESSGRSLFVHWRSRQTRAGRADLFLVPGQRRVARGRLWPREGVGEHVGRQGSRTRVGRGEAPGRLSLRFPEGLVTGQGVLWILLGRLARLLRGVPSPARHPESEVEEGAETGERGGEEDGRQGDGPGGHAL